MTPALSPIRRGFNRIGLFGLVPACVAAVGFLGFAAVIWTQTPRADTTVVHHGMQTHVLPGIVGYTEAERLYPNYAYLLHPRQDALSNAQGLAAGALLFLVLGGFWWAFWAGVGWVAAGFQKDAEP